MLQSLVIKITNAGTWDCNTIGEEIPALRKHLSDLCIIEDLALVRTILHPYHTFIVMVWLIGSFLDSCDNNSTIAHVDGLHINDYWRYDMV